MAVKVNELPAQTVVDGTEIETVGNGIAATVIELTAVPQLGVVTVAVYTPGEVIDAVEVFAPLLHK